MIPPTLSGATGGSFLHRDRLQGRVTVEVAFTDARTDLAEGVVGQPSSRQALDELEVGLGVEVARMRQVHGAAVHVVRRGERAVPEADALITTLPGVALLSRSADCVPVLLADPGAGVIGAVHAGRAGLVADVVPAAVRRMVDLGASQPVAWIGPSVCGSCYEVPAELRREVADRVSESWSETSWGTPALDVAAGVRAQLDSAGVRHTSLDLCTREDDRLWSHRRDGAAAGRMGALVWISDADEVGT